MKQYVLTLWKRSMSSNNEEPQQQQQQAKASPEELAQRDKIIQEIIHTERTFNAGLQVLSKEFGACLQKGGLQEEEFRVLLGNAETLLELSNCFLKELSSNPSEIGRIWVQMAPFFKLFAQYCDEHPNRNVLVDKLMDRASIKNALEELRAEKPQLQSLQSYLILPIQRVPRYVLLLLELVKATPQKLESEYQGAQTALETMKTVATQINDSIRNRENAEKLLTIQKSLFDPSMRSAIKAFRFRTSSNEETSDKAVFAMRRVFLREADLLLTSTSSRFFKQERRVFLFSDQLIHGLIFNKTIVGPVRVLPTKVSIAEQPNSFVLQGLYLDQKHSFTFQCKDEQDTKLWLEDVKKVIATVEQNEAAKAAIPLKDKTDPAKPGLKTRPSNGALPSPKPLATTPVAPPTPKNCESCLKRFNSAPGDIFFRKRSVIRCDNCQRALCQSCVRKSKDDESVRTCGACEAFRVAQKQLTADEETKLIELEKSLIMQKITSNHKRLESMIIFCAFLLFILLFILRNGTSNVFNIGAGGQNLIVFSSSDSKYEWELNEEATIAAAKRLLIDEE